MAPQTDLNEGEPGGRCERLCFPRSQPSGVPHAAHFGVKILLWATFFEPREFSPSPRSYIQMKALRGVPSVKWWWAMDRCERGCLLRSHPDLDHKYKKSTPRDAFICMAVGQGFEPREPLGSTVFKTAAFDHSASPPKLVSTTVEGRAAL